MFSCLVLYSILLSKENVNFSVLQGVDPEKSLLERVKDCSLKSAEDYVTDIDQADLTDTESEVAVGEGIVGLQEVSYNLFHSWSFIILFLYN
jgi:hypothetical protein